MKPTLTPYLYFNGQTKDAMEFYQSILGGELLMQKYSETGMPTSEETKDLIIHAYLKNDALTFMASDGNAEHPITMGDNIHMSVVGSDTEKLTDWFNRLAEGGKIDMPLEKQFWGDVYGMLTDKFGVHWSVNISSGEQPQQ